jgi:hypothetical protein
MEQKSTKAKNHYEHIKGDYFLKNIKSTQKFEKQKLTMNL